MTESVRSARRASVALPLERAAVALTQSFPLRWLRWAALVLLGLSVSAVGWTIWQLRTDAIRAAITESGNIATVLAGQLSRSVHGIDAVLLEVKRATKDLDIDTPSGFRAAFNRRAFRDMLIEHLSRLPQAFNIAVADERGQVTVSTAAWPTPNINVADRDYFQEARARPDQLGTSIPIYNRINGKRTIVFARRLENATGDFAGIIYCSINTEYFEVIYGSIQSVHAHQFTLRKRDGTILARHPDALGLAGQKHDAGPLWHAAVANGGGGYSSEGGLSGGTNFVSVRTVPEYPLVVDISVTESTALAAWRQRSATIGIGSVALLLCSIYLLIAVTRQIRCLSDSEASLAQKSQQLDAALNNMSQGLTMFDARQRLIVCNRQYAEMYGLSAEQTNPGTPFQSILGARATSGNVPEDVESFVTDRLRQVIRAEPTCTVNTLRDGRIVSVTHQSMRDGGWVAVHQDITAQKRAEAELAHMARYDGLTGLANRSRFMEQAHAALARMREHGEEFAILMLDLDRFKTVNDSLGHPVGDSLLQVVAQRLRQMIPDIDSVARLGGDEFAILQSVEQGQKTPAIVLADQILAAITEPYDLHGRKFTIQTSIGITFAPQDGTDADSLLKNADLALYEAKSLGGDRYCLFEPLMETRARERRQLEEDMRKAISRNEFELHYQTIVDAGRQECCGAEALVRWRHPERGLIYPDQFIALAEESGLIVPLGEWILRRACADAAKWPSHLKVAVNLSPAQTKHGDLLGALKSTLADCKLPPNRLELEITETVLLERNEEHLAVLHELKNLGVSIVLDDFGIGYSSMRYLQMFPFDKIKIDKSFIQSMTTHADSAAIVCAITGLGRALDIETTAEGVETTEQFTFLRSAGCQLAQGYLFSRPVPASELTFERPDALRNARAA
jgi:diguanylate cyclase (GGDEF)-like protein/PAS domain S-box-containing protein